ncbi:fructosamine kinase family protein [Jiulongibacter sediminis]|uniref:fructosamine kinase family protein n=1 Tax=Jiulongibacter sediminis TaxID=1605367 RepID=UPI0006DC93F5|nr:fructosamine kinase family protein [Jiulongibacter sediminis]
MIKHIAEVTGGRIEKYQPVSGGDIAEAFVLETANGSLFLKTLQNPDAKDIFSAEAKGLREMEKSQSIKVPEIISIGQVNETSYLLLEYIEGKNVGAKDFEKLGRGVAKMHQYTTVSFGFESDNFIGLLPQSNRTSTSWPEFYTSERLMPQLEKAVKLGHLLPEETLTKERVLKTCKKLLPDCSASLLHGDLWSGNYLIAQSGIPYLIDPAVYYGHREADLAMSRLFGGFDESFYQAYYEVWPKEPEEAERIEIYQLYHLLVHLNLFGLGYKASVKRTLEKYFF